MKINLKKDKLPTNMTEVQSRAKDIMFTEKDQRLRKISKLITRHINLIETLYDIFKENDHSKIDKDIMDYIKKEHKLLVEKFGAKIKIYRISREIAKRLIQYKMLNFQLLQLKILLFKERIKH